MAYKKKYVITTHTYIQYKEGFGFKIKGKIIVSKKNKRNVKFFFKKRKIQVNGVYNLGYSEYCLINSAHKGTYSAVGDLTADHFGFNFDSVL